VPSCCLPQWSLTHEHAARFSLAAQIKADILLANYMAASSVACLASSFIAASAAIFSRSPFEPLKAGVGCANDSEIHALRG
jgi:hypothetical protein